MAQAAQVRERAPWREVAHIETRDTKRGGFLWTLTLSCEHLAFRYAPNPQWRAPQMKPLPIAPHKIRCLACFLARKNRPASSR